MQKVQGEYNNNIFKQVGKFYKMHFKLIQCVCVFGLCCFNVNKSFLCSFQNLNILFHNKY